MATRQDTARGRLTLSRRVGEAVVIGDGIRLVVLDVLRGRVRLGIECSERIPVWRSELLGRVRQELGGDDHDQGTPARPDRGALPAPGAAGDA